MTASSADAALGFRVKTGRAVAVMLAGPAAAPRVLERREIDLWDPDLPDSREPFHVGLERPEPEASAAIARACDAARAVARRQMQALVEALRARGHGLSGVGLVVGSRVDPATLANPHIRAHASEGRLFREVLEAAAEPYAGACRVLVEREAYVEAAAVLGLAVARLQQELAALGAAVGRPWRADERMAALAAWVALPARPSGPPRRETGAGRGPRLRTPRPGRRGPRAGAA